MKINTRQEVEGVTVLELHGKLIIGEGDVQLREAFREAVDGENKKILLDLKGVKMLDSSGLGELVRTRATAASAGATVKLLHVEYKVQEVLEMTRLIGVFETYDDPIDALASFRDG